VELSGQPMVSGRRLSRPMRWLVSLLMMALFMLVLFVFAIGPAMLENYDRAHITTINCKVTAAYAGSASSRSLKGVGASSNQVEYRSPDCGTLVLSGGLTAEAAEEKASGVVGGERYDVKIGQGSARLGGWFQAVGVAPNVLDVRAERGE
jgi:hypothetical protein